MNESKTTKKYHEVIIRDDPEHRPRVAMEKNGEFYVMVVREKKHGTERFKKEQLDFVEKGKK